MEKEVEAEIIEESKEKVSNPEEQISRLRKRNGLPLYNLNIR